MRIKDVVNKILWRNKDELGEFLLVVIDRQSRSGFKYIGFENIKRVDNNYIYVGIDGETIIPLHRVVRIERRNGEIVWQRA